MQTQDQTQNIQPSQQEQLDPTIVNMARAIKTTETKGQKDPYTARGKSGEFGAYQFMPSTWQADAQKYLGQNVPLEQSTMEQQNKVAYHKIKELKDRGYTPAQVASYWNSNDPEAYKGTFSMNAATHKAGDPSSGVHKNIRYDVPGYANSVVSAYEQYKGGQTNPSVQLTQSTVEDTTPAHEKTLGEQLTSRVNDLGKGLSMFGKGTVAGGFSGTLQSLGAVAGGVGDVVNKGMELIPGVKKVEDLIGQGVGSLAQTSAGQAVTKSIKEFTDAHPEVADDIGAGFNIITAIPILKGLGAIKNVAMDGVSSALKGVAEKGALKDLTETASRTIGGRRALANSPEAFKTLVDERLLPDVEGGKLTTKEAFDKAEDLISQRGEKLDQVLSKTHGGTRPVLSVNQARNQALASAEKELEGQSNYDAVTNKINSMFDAAEKSKRALKVNGDTYLNLKDSNFFKRQGRTGLSWDDDVGRSAGFHVGQAYMQAIEDIASKEGMGDVHELNQQIAKVMKAQNMLKYVDGKPVKTGLFGKMLREGVTDAATLGGEAIGSSMGLPYAGTLTGRGAGSLASRALGGISPTKALRNSVLRRTGTGAVRTTARQAIQGAGGLVGANLANRLAK